MSGRGRILLWATLLSVALLSALAGAGLAACDMIRDSLPPLQGERTLAGLAGVTLITRDAHGIASIRAASRLDAARATGFLHAQERFFQMDLLRRSAAGELSELVGAKTVPYDLELRRHLFRQRAIQLLHRAPAPERLLLDAYAAGVNAGLASLASPPFEYRLLGVKPRSWQPEDVYLVVYTMYLRLQGDTDWRDASYGALHAAVPPALYAFLTPSGTAWDAALDGSEAPAPAPMPGPDVLDLRRRSNRHPLPKPQDDIDTPVAGSNAFAVAGARTAEGGSALLANDMHLELTAPGIWYHLALRYQDADGDLRRVCGISLPGTPAIVAGSNGRVAWGFTNSVIDVSDLIALRAPEGQPALYRTPEGAEPYRHVHEVIRVHGGNDVPVDIPYTRWGPVLPEGPAPHALHWLAYEPDAVNLRLLGLERVQSVHEALELAPHLRLPTQNFIAADAAGHVGWTLAGAIPERRGLSGRYPERWDVAGAGWAGTLPADAYPRVEDPEDGYVWSANARPLGGVWLERLGDGGYTLGARARQIRTDLANLRHASESDLLAVQLDDRADFLLHWRELLVKVLDEADLPVPQVRIMRRVLDDWDGHASVDAAGYRLVRSFRRAVDDAVFPALTEAAYRLDPEFDYRLNLQREQPLWTLVTQRPPHLLNPEYPSWDALLAAAAHTAFEASRQSPLTLRLATWGDYNRVQVRHPLSRAVPWLSPLLDMPATPLPGDLNMPRIQTRTHGASMRMVVAPGHEADGILELPAGASGNPLSPYYREGHTAWEQGTPVPFLPGRPVHELRLLPAG